MVYKWLANQMCYSKSLNNSIVSYLKCRCKRELLDSIDLRMWSIIEDEEYNEEMDCFCYF